MSPTFPIGFEIVITLLAAAVLALTVIAVVSISRRRVKMSDTANGSWIVAVVLFPVVMPAAWFLLGAPEVDRREVA